LGQLGKSRTVTVLAVLTAVTALAIWLRRQELNPQPVIEAGSATVAPASAAETPGSAVSETEKFSQPAATLGSQGAAENIPDPEFGRWIEDEAKQLDNVNVDSAQKRQEIRRVVSKITPQQSRQLLQTVKNPRSPAGEKILSTYLLVEAGSKAHGELADLISSPLTEAQDFEAHSVEEMKGIREKSLRIMAIDGLFSQAQREPGARTALARAAQEASDPTIRAYAEDKLRQLQ
jgi:hypothetical protein